MGEETMQLETQELLKLIASGVEAGNARLFEALDAQLDARLQEAVRAALQTELKETNSRLAEMRVLLLGNGHPEKGALWRIKTLEERYADFKELARQRDRDLRGVMMPVLVDAFKWSLASIAFVVLGHLFGLFK